MHRIADDAGWAGVSRSAWREVAQALGELSVDLRRHERAEEALAAEALLTDEGGGD